MASYILTAMATIERKCAMSFMFLVGIILVHLAHNVCCDITEMDGSPDTIDSNFDEKSSLQSCEKEVKEQCSGGSGETVDTGGGSGETVDTGGGSGETVDTGGGSGETVDTSDYSTANQPSGAESSEDEINSQTVAETEVETKELDDHTADTRDLQSGIKSDVDDNDLEKGKNNDIGEIEQNTESTPLTENGTETETNSTIMQWLKYFIDPFLEEFRDGMYSNISEKSNQTETNSSDIHVVERTNSTETNVTDSLPANVTETDSHNITDSSKKVKFQCTGRNITDYTNATVKVITSAKFLQLLTFERNETDNSSDCLVVMFYAPWCQFCAKTAPHYNALARAYPQLDFVAVDTAQFSNILARFGTVYVPNILVFHQSRAAVKFNHTEREFNTFVSFIKNTTGMEPNATVNVMEDDYMGPVPSVPTDDPDYLLLISWIFVIFCSTCMFVKSHKGQQWIARVRVLWQEHQHID